MAMKSLKSQGSFLKKMASKLTSDRKTMSSVANGKFVSRRKKNMSKLLSMRAHGTYGEFRVC